MPKTKTSLYLPEDLYADFKKAAEAHGESVSEALRNAMRLYTHVPPDLLSRAAALASIWHIETGEVISRALHTSLSQAEEAMRRSAGGKSEGR